MAEEGAVVEAAGAAGEVGLLEEELLLEEPVLLEEPPFAAGVCDAEEPEVVAAVPPLDEAAVGDDDPEAEPDAEATPTATTGTPDVGSVKDVIGTVAPPTAALTWHFESPPAMAHVTATAPILAMSALKRASDGLKSSVAVRSPEAKGSTTWSTVVAPFTVT